MGIAEAAQCASVIPALYSAHTARRSRAMAGQDSAWLSQRLIPTHLTNLRDRICMQLR